MSTLNIDNVIAHLLVVEGFSNVEEVAYVSKDELLAIEGFDENIVNELQTRAKKYLEDQKQIFNQKSEELGVKKDLKEFEGLDDKSIIVLAKHNIKTLDDLADLSSDELVEILESGEVKMDKTVADNVIIEARKHWFN